jgi:hypothetical protein
LPHTVYALNQNKNSTGELKLPDQQQEAVEDSIAIQSGGDTTIVIGASEAFLTQTLDALVAQIPVYIEQAREVVDLRLVEFKREILQLFKDTTDTGAEISAFKNPDFVHAVGKAQEQYTRSGEKENLQLLAALVVVRSRETNRTRLSLTLNDAIEKSAVLTKNEFSALALSLLLRNYQGNFPSQQHLATFLNNIVIPLLDDFTKDHSCCSYLASHSCGNLTMVGSTLEDVFWKSYSGLFSKGFDRNFWANCTRHHSDRGLIDQLLIPCINNSELLQLNALNEDVFVEVAGTKCGIEPQEARRIYNAVQEKKMSRQEMIEHLSSTVPRIQELFDAMSRDSYLCQFNLTAVGMAIGHAYARKNGFSEDLSIWIS